MSKAHHLVITFVKASIFISEMESTSVHRECIEHNNMKKCPFCGHGFSMDTKRHMTTATSPLIWFNGPFVKNKAMAPKGDHCCGKCGSLQMDVFAKSNTRSQMYACIYTQTHTHVYT